MVYGAWCGSRLGGAGSFPRDEVAVIPPDDAAASCLLAKQQNMKSRSPLENSVGSFPLASGLCPAGYSRGQLSRILRGL
ncbi:hypothetical protein Q3G72_026420 [Acer saccharum]|nr:hypothetical protein Q3G72_026420 [Acer saccharum]